MAELKTIVFFAARDPALDPDPVRNAFAFALTAAKSELPTEVRLAGGALNALHTAKIPATPAGDRLRKSMADAARQGIHVTL